MSPASSDVVISDSEPEREKERLRLRRFNGSTHIHVQPIQPLKNKAISVEGIIDISDDSTMSDSNGSIIVVTGNVASGSCHGHLF